ncbi:MAG TPA: hypothetical protein VI299_05240, partial [Polyangiales bacterium]
MSSPATELAHAIGAFRRDHAHAYLRQLAGQPFDPRFEGRARAFLASERADELLEQAKPELSAGVYAASCAQLARASFEVEYASARSATSGLLAREVSVEGETRSLGALLGEWAGLSQCGPRERILSAMAPALEQFATKLASQRAHADDVAGL